MKSNKLILFALLFGVLMTSCNKADLKPNQINSENSLSDSNGELIDGWIVNSEYHPEKDKGAEVDENKRLKKSNGVVWGIGASNRVFDQIIVV
ncbi:MAG: hypothetical protein ACJASQ_003113 [Crocinitomicaceae bacterium]|jgi:hypothetical protein